MSETALTDQERAFCRAYVLDPSDPLGCFIDAFDPDGGLCLEEVANCAGALLDRNEILLEIHALRRMVEETDEGRILLEMEEARRKALGEQYGAEVARNATLAKAQLLGMLPVPTWTLPAENDETPIVPRGQPDPNTVH